MKHLHKITLFELVGNSKRPTFARDISLLVCEKSYHPIDIKPRIIVITIFQILYCFEDEFILVPLLHHNFDRSFIQEENTVVSFVCEDLIGLENFLDEF